jgi:hypothetical protein
MESKQARGEMCLRFLEVLPCQAKLIHHSMQCANLEILGPQSGIVVPCLIAGLYHFRCDPLPRRGSSWQPKRRSFLATSR